MSGHGRDDDPPSITAIERRFLELEAALDRDREDEPLAGHPLATVSGWDDTGPWRSTVYLTSASVRAARSLLRQGATPEDLWRGLRLACTSPARDPRESLGTLEDGVADRTAAWRAWLSENGNAEPGLAATLAEVPFTAANASPTILHSGGLELRGIVGCNQERGGSVVVIHSVEVGFERARMRAKADRERSGS